MEIYYRTAKISWKKEKYKSQSETKSLLDERNDLFLFSYCLFYLFIKTSLEIVEIFLGISVI